MALEKFSLAALSRMDGGVLSRAFEQALRRMHVDCADRPFLKKPRTVKLQLTMVPVCADNGELESIDVSLAIDDDAPVRQSRSYNMLAQRGVLLFNELSPDEARQRTLDEATKPAAVRSAEPETEPQEGETDVG